MKNTAIWVWSNIVVPICAALGLGAFASQALGTWLHQNGYLDHPENLIATLVAWLANPSNSWWLLPICAVLLLVPAGWALWKRYVKWLEQRHADLMDLGGEMTSMASKIRIDQAGFRNPWPGNIERRRGALEAIFAKARRFGLEQPDDGIFSLPEGLGRLIGYLDFVGAHLKNGNFRVAKKRSRDLA